MNDNIVAVHRFCIYFTTTSPPSHVKRSPPQTLAAQNRQRLPNKPHTTAGKRRPGLNKQPPPKNDHNPAPPAKDDQRPQKSINERTHEDGRRRWPTDEGRQRLRKDDNDDNVTVVVVLIVHWRRSPPPVGGRLAPPTSPLPKGKGMPPVGSHVTTRNDAKTMTTAYKRRPDDDHETPSTHHHERRRPAPNKRLRPPSNDDNQTTTITTCERRPAPTKNDDQRQRNDHQRPERPQSHERPNERARLRLSQRRGNHGGRRR